VKVDSKNYSSSFSFLIYFAYVAKKIIGLIIYGPGSGRLRDVVYENHVRGSLRKMHVSSRIVANRWRMLFSLRHDNDDADDDAKVEIPDGDWLSRKISRDKLSLK